MLSEGFQIVKVLIVEVLNDGSKGGKGRLAG